MTATKADPRRKGIELAQALAAGLPAEADNYVNAHIAARILLGLTDGQGRCSRCGATEADLGDHPVSWLHAALDHATPADRLRVYRGRHGSYFQVYSARPDLDYIALCRPCHQAYDDGYSMRGTHWPWVTTWRHRLDWQWLFDHADHGA